MFLFKKKEKTKNGSIPRNLLNEKKKESRSLEPNFQMVCVDFFFLYYVHLIVVLSYGGKKKKEEKKERLELFLV